MYEWRRFCRQSAPLPPMLVVTLAAWPFVVMADRSLDRSDMALASLSSSPLWTITEPAAAAPWPPSPCNPCPASRPPPSRRCMISPASPCAMRGADGCMLPRTSDPAADPCRPCMALAWSSANACMVPRIRDPTDTVGPSPDVGAPMPMPMPKPPLSVPLSVRLVRPESEPLFRDRMCDFE